MFERRKISNIELHTIVVDAIEDDQTMGHLFHRLKADGIAMDQYRLRRMWIACGGRLQGRRSGL